MKAKAKPARRNIVALHARMRTGAGLHGDGRKPEADWVEDWEYESELAAEVAFETQDAVLEARRYPAK